MLLELVPLAELPLWDHQDNLRMEDFQSRLKSGRLYLVSTKRL